MPKLARLIFREIARPGDQIRLNAKLVNVQNDGAILEGQVEINGVSQASMELTFAILDDSFGTQPFFIPSDLSRIMRSLKLFDVGVYPDGRRIEVPEHMIAAEIDALTTPPD